MPTREILLADRDRFFKLWQRERDLAKKYYNMLVNAGIIVEKRATGAASTMENPASEFMYSFRATGAASD